MVWAFHAKANTSRRAPVCQACLIESRQRGEKGLVKQPGWPCPIHGLPELWAENELSWYLWSITRTQALIFSTNDPKKPMIVLNFAAILPVIALYVDGREAQREVFESILLCHQIDQSKGVFDYFK